MVGIPTGTCLFRGLRRSSAQLHAERGAASVEHAGLALLIALLTSAGVAALAANPPDRKARELGTAIARKMRCAPRLPGPCWRDPLTEAYGRPLAGLARALAPVPRTVAGLLPVDFRYCRQASCAMPGARPELTASNRRVTAFLAIEDRRRGDGSVRLDYWLYRPTVGWESVTRTASAADIEGHAATPLLETDHPRLVPLETLDGRNHVAFPAGEAPPWRWRIESVYR
jgi:hypothetical protein